MSDLIVELFSEEIPPNLQISARKQLKKILNDELESLNLTFSNFEIYSTPTRLTIFISNLPKKNKNFVFGGERTKSRCTTKCS